MLWIDKTSYHVNRIAKGLLVVLMSIMVLDVLFGVMNRFILKLTVSWTEEVARYLMIWICMIGSTIALKEGTHVAVNLFILKFKESNRNIIIFINNVLIFAFLIIPAFWGIKICFSQMGQTSPALRISMFWPFLSVPVGSIIMILHIISIQKAIIKGKAEV